MYLPTYQSSYLLPGRLKKKTFYTIHILLGEYLRPKPFIPVEKERKQAMPQSSVCEEPKELIISMVGNLQQQRPSKYNESPGEGLANRALTRVRA